VTNLTIGITPRTAASPARLRADGIQDAALIQLGRMLAEGDDGARHLIDALESLGTVSYDPADGELDGALDDVRSLAGLDAAVMDLTNADVEQLADEAVHAGAIADGSVTQIPQPREGGAAA
jgi:hypothetical protein